MLRQKIGIKWFYNAHNLRFLNYNKTLYIWLRYRSAVPCWHHPVFCVSNIFNLTIIFKPEATRIFLQRSEQAKICRRQLRPACRLLEGYILRELQGAEIYFHALIRIILRAKTRVLFRRAIHTRFLVVRVISGWSLSLKSSIFTPLVYSQHCSKFILLLLFLIFIFSNWQPCKMAYLKICLFMLQFIYFHIAF